MFLNEHFPLFKLKKEKVIKEPVKKVKEKHQLKKESKDEEKKKIKKKVDDLDRKHKVADVDKSRRESDKVKRDRKAEKERLGLEKSIKNKEIASSKDKDVKKVAKIISKLSDGSVKEEEKRKKIK